MSKYGFRVNLDPVESNELAQGGYSLAIFKRNTGSNGPSVLWVAEPIEADNISVTWTNRYQAFFTTTNLNNSATIVQTSSSRVNLGASYSYQNGLWTHEQESSPNGGSLRIKNNNDRVASFGIAQMYQNSAGKDVYSPLAVQGLVQPSGRVEFTPKEEITVCFSLTKKSGTISVVETASIDTTLSTGEFPLLKYRKGKWTEEFGGLAVDIAAHRDDGLWQYRFEFPRHVYPAKLAQTIEQHLPKYLVTSASADPSTAIEITLYGLPDPTAAVADLKGKLVTDLARTLVAPGFWKIEGEEALIYHIVPVVSPLSVIWNSLHKK